MDKEFQKSLLSEYNEAETIPDIFEVVKYATKEVLKKERAGLMLGLADLGTSNKYWIGGYWAVGSNAIIMNSIPLKRIEDTDPKLFKPYMFNIMLHEYVHSIGVLDEERTRAITHQISIELFGENHVATKMAADISKFLPNLRYPGIEWQPEAKDFRVTLVQGFDKSNTRYVG